MKEVKMFLDATDQILATHDGADKPADQGGYCYLSTPENLGRCSIREVSPEEALSEGWAEIRDGVFFVGPFAVCPVVIDYRTTRRRVEDALRKTATNTDLIRIAAMLNVSIA